MNESLALWDQLSATETYRLVVSLAAACDGDLVEHVVARHPDRIPAAHLEAYCGIASELQELINEYEYVESPAFLNSIQGKSTAVAAMMQKIASDPAHRKAHQRKFVAALYQLPESRAAFALIAERHHEVLLRALSAIAAASGEAAG